MLQAIRDKVTGWIAYGIIFLISIPFALWGINSYLGGGEVPPAAVVNGEEVTLQELDQAYANYRQRLAQLFGGRIPESLGDESMLRQQVLEQLIEETALRQYVEKSGYRVGDEALSRMIREMPAFQTDGNFDSGMYQAQLRSLGQSPVGFEERLRISRAVQQFAEGVTSSAFMLPLERKRYVSLRNQSRKIRTLVHSTDPSSIQIDDDEIEQYYLANGERFRTPEQVRIDYIEVSLEDVKQAVGVDADSLRARYEDNIETYSSPEIRSASHILLQADEDNDAAVRARIEELRQRIVAGESFADLAREFSEDPGSAEDGGDLGEIEPGVMVEAFEDALNALEVGQLSEPVRTAFGWHLIKLHKVRGGEVKSFESVREQLEDEIRSEQAESEIFDLVENLANLVYEQPESLLPASEQLGLEVRTSDWFDRFSGTGIAAEQKIRSSAFSEEVLQQELNSDAIELDGGRVVFLRVNQVRPPAQRPLEEVRDQIRAELIGNRIRQRNQQAGISALEALNAGTGSLDALAAEWPSSIEDKGFVKRDQSEIDPSVLNKAFAMPKPESGPVHAGLSLANGDYIIIELSAVVSNDAEADPEALDQLAASAAEAEFQAIMKLLTSRADVVLTPPDELDY